MANIIDLVVPKPNSTVLIYDVHASESGALSILDDLYNQVKDYEDKSVLWVFVVSLPKYEQTTNIVVDRFPWVKKNWLLRFYFETFTTRELLKKYKPNVVVSLQNKGINFYHGQQIVYLHLPFILTDHRFDVRVDGTKLWFYQNVFSKSIFRSLRKVDLTVVQTQWMKSALIRKAHVEAKRIVVQQPDISSNEIMAFDDTPNNRKRLFYPATAFFYKNHITLLKALKYAQYRGYSNYELILTIRENDNNYTQKLCNFVRDNNLNVFFCGRISRQQVFSMYKKSVLVFPSYVESFGLPLLEARMTGSPIIASDTPFCREILDGYSKVSFFSETDYETLGKEIIKVGNPSE